MPRSSEIAPLQGQVGNEIKNTSFTEKLKYVRSNITVEPILVGWLIPSMLSRLAMHNLNIDKACRVKKGYSDEICDALIDRKGNSTYEAEVQVVIANIESWKSVIQRAIPTIIIIFMGAWSDRKGNRKICILMPLVGELMVCLTNIVSTYFYYEIRIEVSMILEALFPAVTGGWLMLCLGVFSYICDITKEESRTFRVTLVNVCIVVGGAMGTALSGILIKNWGYYGNFTIAGCVYMVTFIYGFIYLKSYTKTEKKMKNPETITFGEVVMLVKETGYVAIKKRDSFWRLKIILTLLLVAIVYGPNHEDSLVQYLFVRYRLQWDAWQYSIYSTYAIATHSIGLIFTISVLIKRIGIHDSILCLISVSSKFVGSIVLIFVQTTFQMYIVPTVEMLNVATLSTLRSMISKLVLPEEVGKVHSLFCLSETLALLILDSVYFTLYSRTINVFTGAVFVFNALLSLLAIIILIWLFIQSRKERAEKLEQTRIE